MKKVIQFIKKEIVLVIACILALVSSFIVPPDTGYIGYIDFRTLSILFCLMSVMAGFQKIGIFTFFAERLITKVKGTRYLMFILVMLCFFFSMIITNDVALITFVPFTVTVLILIGKEKLTIPIVSLQTVAANLGSMLTPIGNPQNLYLYGKSGMGLGEFILLMLPYTIMSFVLLTVFMMFYKNDKGEVMLKSKTEIKKNKRIVIYPLLFIVSLMAVAKIIDYKIAFIISVIVILIFDRLIFRYVDYSLLVTFAAFFIFIGNMGRIEVFKNMIENIIIGRECITAVASSQIVSNVPAALLLSGFTDKTAELIVGTNIGGLGTLIASMASLISFKYVAAIENKMKYILYFTAVNVVFLIVLLGMYFII